MTHLELFHVQEPTAEEPVEKLSRSRRLTARQRADVERGIHPLTRGKALPDLGTCGGYAHLEKNAWGYLKCSLGPKSHSASTDVRAWWPACERHPTEAAGAGSDSGSSPRRAPENGEDPTR